MAAVGVAGEGVLLAPKSVLRVRTEEGGREGIDGRGAVEDTLALFVFLQSFLILFIETKLPFALGVVLILCDRVN